MRGDMETTAFSVAKGPFAIGLGAVFALGAASVARSQESDVASANPPYELTLYAGYQSGGHLDLADTDAEVYVDGQAVYALGMNFADAEHAQYQVYYSHQPTHVVASEAFPSSVDVDIDYVHFGGTLRVAPGTPLEPYVVGSIGATLLSAQFPGADDEQLFSLGFGAGLRIPLHKSFNVLLEGRAFLSFMPAGGALFCSSGQTGAGCRLEASGSTFVQYTLMLGASFPF